MIHFHLLIDLQTFIPPLRQLTQLAINTEKQQITIAEILTEQQDRLQDQTSSPRESTSPNVLDITLSTTVKVTIIRHKNVRPAHLRLLDKSKTAFNPFERHLAQP